MIHPLARGAGVVLVLPMLLLATACIAVSDEDGKTDRVAIHTPLGAVAVRSGEDSGRTGLPVYPGAELSRDADDGDAESATVSVATPWVGVHVVAAEYESLDSPAHVVAYYREQMRGLGTVIECRGEVGFDTGQPQCRSVASSEDIQLLVGSEERHRTVVVKPRGAGTEFALVSVELGGT